VYKVGVRGVKDMDGLRKKWAFGRRDPYIKYICWAR
jgi:hypothetical protein